MKELSYEGLGLGKEKSDIAFCLLKGRVRKDKILNFEIVGDSMSPFLNQGDTASVRTVEFQDLQKGDIIVYGIGKHLCAHRYIYPIKSSFSNEVKNDDPFVLITKADNASCFDQLPVSREQLIGKIISIRRKDKNIDLGTTFWKVINYFLASISALQVYLLIFLRFLRRTLLPDIEFPFGSSIEKSLCFVLSIPCRIVVHIIPLLGRKIQS